MAHKVISRATFVWSHIGVVIFHVMVCFVIIFAAWKMSQTTLYVTAVVLLLVSLGSLAPILKHDTYTID